MFDTHDFRSSSASFLVHTITWAAVDKDSASANMSQERGLGPHTAAWI